MHQAHASFRHLCLPRPTQCSKQIQTILSRAGINTLLLYCLLTPQQRRLGEGGERVTPARPPKGDASRSVGSPVSSRRRAGRSVSPSPPIPAIGRLPRPQPGLTCADTTHAKSSLASPPLCS